MTSSFPRRTVLALFAGGVLPLAGGGCIVTGDPPLPVGRVRSVRLDASPLAERGLPGYAARLTAVGQPILAAAFADILAPNDPTAPDVVVTVTGVTLPSTPDDDPQSPMHGNEDRMTGELLVTIFGSPRRRRMVASASARMAGPWTAPDFDDRRLANLLRIYAAWARREIA